jgi:hypothetical protein
MTSIIFQNLIDNTFETTNKINSFFNNYDKYDTQIFNLLNTLPKEHLLTYIFIVFILFRFISTYTVNSSHIFSLLIVCIIIYFLANNDYFNFMKYTNKKKEEINFLHKLMYENKDKWITASNENFFITPIEPYKKSYLYLNSAMIDYFIQFKNISSFNISAYVDCLFHCNNVIGIEYEAKLGLNRDYLNYNSAILEKNKALNSINSAIYNIPEGNIPKYMEGIKFLHGLLNQHLKQIGDYLKKDVKFNGLRVDRAPDDLYEVNFLISPDDTQTSDYISTYNMYC